MANSIPGRLVDCWPSLARQLHDALLFDGEDALADQVGTLRVLEPCGCGDDFCQIFYTEPKPEGAYGLGHRNIALAPPWNGLFILDIVNEVIAYVEVLYREPLD